MKPILLSENIGVIVGHLCAPDQIQIDNGGCVEKYSLTGNVVETKGYDVVAIGKKTGEGVFDVSVMESIPDEENPYDVYDARIEDKHIEVLAFHKSLVRKHEKIVKDDKTYTNIDVDTKNGIMHARTVREDYRDPDTGSIILLVQNKGRETGILKDVKEFGSGYAKKKVTSYYCTGIQMLS